jgi:hypothetical protein
MNRLFAAAVLVLTVAGFAVSEGRAQTPVRTSRMALQGWQAERAFHLSRIMERARAQLNNTLIKVEIGTMAPIDVDASRQAVAQMDALIKADAARADRPVQAVSAIRLKLAEALNALDFSEVQFENGMISTKTMNDAYLAIVTLLLS